MRKNSLFIIDIICQLFTLTTFGKILSILYNITNKNFKLLTIIISFIVLIFISYIFWLGHETSEIMYNVQSIQDYLDAKDLSCAEKYSNNYIIDMKKLSDLKISSVSIIEDKHLPYNFSNALDWRNLNNSIVDPKYFTFHKEPFHYVHYDRFSYIKYSSVQRNLIEDIHVPKEYIIHKYNMHVYYYNIKYALDTLQEMIKFNRYVFDQLQELKKN